MGINLSFIMVNFIFVDTTSDLNQKKFPLLFFVQLLVVQTYAAIVIEVKVYST